MIITRQLNTLLIKITGGLYVDFMSTRLNTRLLNVHTVLDYTHKKTFVDCKPRNCITVSC